MEYTMSHGLYTRYLLFFPSPLLFLDDRSINNMKTHHLLYSTSYQGVLSWIGFILSKPLTLPTLWLRAYTNFAFCPLT